MKARSAAGGRGQHMEKNETWVVESSYLLGFAAALQCSAPCDAQSRGPGQVTCNPKNVGTAQVLANISKLWVTN